MVVATGCRVHNAAGFDDNRNNADVLSSVVDNRDKMSAKAILICRDNSHSFQERTLDLEQPVKIGRSVARARAATNNAIFDCKVLSRNHALLCYSAGKFYLQDTKSSNGTFVNNQRLSATGLESQPREVCSGDIVQFGVDVMESTKKVTHGCIVATLKLYLPDGKEAKASRSMSVACPAGDVTLEDLYKLNRYVQEANRREEALHGKLALLQTLVENTRKATDQSWKALIDEDRLLSRVNTVESQLVACSKNMTEDKIRNELVRLEDEKARYQIVAKETLRKIHDEKSEVTQKLVQLESRLNETEEECQSLHDVSKHAQMELQELAAKYSEAQRNLQFMENKLVEKEESSSEIVKWAMQEKNDLLKKVEEQAKVERYLQEKLRNCWLEDHADTPKHITAMRNYVRTLVDANPKLLTDSQVATKDGVNPIEAINAILNKLDAMLARQNATETIVDTNLSNSANDENSRKSQDVDSNQLSTSNLNSDEQPEQQRTFDKNELDDTSNKREDSSEYVIESEMWGDLKRRQQQQQHNQRSPHSRRTLVNGSETNLDDSAEMDATSEQTTDDTCSVGSDDTWSVTVDEAVEKSVIEMKPVDNNDEETNNTNANEKTVTINSHASSSPLRETGRKLEVTFASGTNGKDLEEVHYDHSYRPEVEFADVTNAGDGNGGDDDSSSDSAESPNESLAVASSIVADETAEPEDRRDNVDPDDDCDGEHVDGDYVKTLKPLSNAINRSDSQTRDYMLGSLMKSLESLGHEDDSESQRIVNRELEQLRDWLVRETTDNVVDKLKEVYYRAKNEEQRIQEVNEELVILKEKYNLLNGEKCQIYNQYKNLKEQCGDLLNTSYSVPIQYVAPIAVALVWLLFGKLF